MQLIVPEGFGRAPNSVAVRNGVVAVAVEAATKTDPGYAIFFDNDGRFLSGVQVGEQPDMIIFAPDGTKVLTADEGEPNDGYSVDPEGSVSIVDISGGLRNLTAANVTIAHFRKFNGRQLDPSIRIYGPRATIAQDLEPEFIAVSGDSRKAYVTLQKNNAIAVVDLTTKTVERLIGLGFNLKKQAPALMPAIVTARLKSRPGSFMVCISPMPLQSWNLEDNGIWSPPTKVMPGVGADSTKKCGSTR